LDLIVGVSMRSGTTARKGAEQEDGNVHVAVISPDELVGATLEWQVLLTNAVHLPILLSR
jgi:hypothetical protein